MTTIDPHGPDPRTYDRVLVARSGGKDRTSRNLQELRHVAR